MRLTIGWLAQADLDDIWVYIASESGSSEVADRVLDSIGHTLNLLRRSPYAGRSRDIQAIFSEQ